MRVFLVLGRGGTQGWNGRGGYFIIGGGVTLPFIDTMVSIPNVHGVEMNYFRLFFADVS